MCQESASHIVMYYNGIYIFCICTIKAGDHLYYKGRGALQVYCVYHIANIQILQYVLCTSIAAS